MIDLVRLARIDARLVDRGGQPRSNHAISLRGMDGRHHQATTDAAGQAAFPELSPGHYTILAAPVSRPNWLRRNTTEEVDLERGETRMVELTISKAGPLEGRIAVTGESDFSGFLARLPDFSDWLEVARNGALPMDLETEASSLEVRATDGRRWSIWLSACIEDGQAFRLDAGEGSYSGLLLDANGRPLGNRRLFVTSWMTVTPFASTMTDPDGRFKVQGLAPIQHYFHLLSDSEEIFRGNLSGQIFRPTLPASEHPEVTIRLPEALEPAVLQGRVVRESSREALADAVLLLRTELEMPGGSWWLARNESIVRADPDGGFRIQVPHASAVTVMVFEGRPDTEPLLTQVFDADDLRDGQAIELAIPSP